MALSASMGGLWGDFIAIFWIIEYLERPIYIWNKVSKHIVSTWHGFSIYPLISCLHNVNENKPPLYQVLNKIYKNKIIPLVQKLTQIKTTSYFTTSCFCSNLWTPRVWAI
jgi:hypothetical protein